MKAKFKYNRSNGHAKGFKKLKLNRIVKIFYNRLYYWDDFYPIK